MAKSEKDRKKQDPEKPQKIETRIPNNLAPAAVRQKTLVPLLQLHTMDYLKIFYKSLFGKIINTNKKEIIKIISIKLTFTRLSEFEEWFFSMPEQAQIILYETVFTDYMPISLLKNKISGSAIVKKNSDYSWRTVWIFDPELDLDYLSVKNYCGVLYTDIPAFLREVLRLWLSPPHLSDLSFCKTNETGQQPDTGNENINIWNNSQLIPDVYPLLCDALQNLMEGANELEREKFVKNGINKSTLNELRSSTGFLPFNLKTDYSPDSLDLAARFVLCMCNFKPVRPKDGQEGIRNLVRSFFAENSKYEKKWYAPDRAFLEYNICIDYLAKTQGYYLENNNELPEARRIFYEILMHAAGDENWFDADKLAEHIRITNKNFSFCRTDLEKTFKIRAESLVIDGIVCGDDYNDFHSRDILRFYLLVRPLFKAYCYIFAVLGILEIIQVMPAPAKITKKKQLPLSPYDSLKAIRITPLGRWCLGLTKSQPPKPLQEYQAIADRELFLVTVQGNSLEHKLYLDKIGQRLGENRWKISPASLINGCINKKQITDRIEKFRSLIDPNPAAHWEQLFLKVIDRINLFEKPRSDMLIYDLPENPEIAEELLRNPEFKKIIKRMEGKMLAIAAKDQKKFFALLNEHGITHF